MWGLQHDWRSALGLQLYDKRRHLSPLDLFHREGEYDVWWCQHACERDHMFFSTRHQSYSHIDLFVTEKWLLQRISSSSIHDITWSDHAEISTVTEEQETLPKGLLWRCNVKLLQDNDVSQIVSQHLWDFVTNNVNSVWVCLLSDIQSFLAKLHLSALTDEQLNAPFTDLEISKSIQSLPTGKAPRSDGLPNEYYKLFANTLIPHLNPVFTKAMYTSHFPPEMLKAQVVALPKMGKDPTTPANFRLIWWIWKFKLSC